MKDNDLVKVDIVDVLLDPENRAPITMLGNDGQQLTFEQVCVIPYTVEGEEKLYTVLKPLTEIEGIGEDEAIVFRVEVDDKGEGTLVVEEDEMIAIEIFNKYYDLLEEASKEEDPKKKKPKK